MTSSILSEMAVTNEPRPALLREFRTASDERAGPGNEAGGRGALKILHVELVML